MIVKSKQFKASLLTDTYWQVINETSAKNTVIELGALESSNQANGVAQVT